MANPKRVLDIFLIFFLFLRLSMSTKLTYNVQNFGAKPDGRTDSTKAFLSAWAAACAANPANNKSSSSSSSVLIIVPAGRYLVGAAAFWGQNCWSKAINIRIYGTLVAPSDYRTLGFTGNWLKFERVSGVTITGGTLDAQGNALWSCKSSSGTKSCPAGATTLAFYNSDNIVVSGLKSLNSQLFHVILDGCHNSRLQNIKISASSISPNTDGIHIQDSSGVTISGTTIGTGDDCVSIGPGTSNVWIENVSCGPGHGISIGSLGWDLQEAGVQNVTVKGSTFKGTQNGLRIKTWARPSNGYVKGVLFQTSVMVNVRYPIIIDQSYCPNSKNCPSAQGSGVKISEVRYEDIHGTSALPVAVKMDCSKTFPCTRITMKDVNLTYRNQPATASCSNIAGTSSVNVHPSGCF